MGSGIAESSHRLLREASFHDALTESGGRPADRFYAISGRSWNAYRELLLREARLRSAPGRPARVLEYGCGIGSYSSRVLAEHGFGATGIDISPASVDAAKRWAAAEFPGVDLDYEVMNAEQLEFPDDSFDVVCGTGVLHHLDLDRSYEQVARVLAPGGSAVFTEPLGHNPLINLYRRLTPAQRTYDEHPLRMSDLRRVGERFGSVEVRVFHLLALLAIPFVDRRAFHAFLGALESADRLALHRLSPLRRYGWLAVIRLAQPRP